MASNPGNKNSKDRSQVLEKSKRKFRIYSGFCLLTPGFFFGKED
jgi:hypothetical protein